MRPMLSVIACLLAWSGTLFAPGAGATHTCSLPSAERVAWWPANLDSADAFGCRDATLSGASYLQGRVVSAFAFDGVDDYASAPSSPLWSLGSEDFVISFWFYLEEAIPSSGTWGYYFVGADEGAGDKDKWIILLRSGPGGTGLLTFHVNDPAPNSLFDVEGAFTPVADTWYHVATVRSGNSFRLLVDGSEVASATSSLTLPDPAAALTIGSAEGGGFFAGRIDELLIAKAA